uniref:Uncharacterized protein n=1 Tax=Trieres chinensis TaxID=1514140 RepID=A0A7S1ZBA1_TRICV|mmetsp:Transcript_21862/g.44255  ORF Transcript_21862/g.44255 Transcript_21862/m.44255 type:complete len:181 (+) Transcript_21862:134-676(+)
MWSPICLILLSSLLFRSSLAGDDCSVPLDVLGLKTAYDQCRADSGSGFQASRHKANHCVADYGRACLNLNHVYLTVTRDTGFAFGACVPTSCSTGSCEVVTDVIVAKQCNTRGSCKEGNEIPSTRWTNCSGRMKVMMDLVGSLDGTDERGVCEGGDAGEQTCNLDGAPWWWSWLPWNWNC